MRRLFLVLSLGASLALAACASESSTPGPSGSSPAPGMTMYEPGQISPPPVRGFAGGQSIWFVHTEASDVQTAELLSKMMGHKVVVVPQLAGVMPAALADLFVFTNGVKGDGPFGFQPDLFDGTPADNGYTPLRRVVLVTWRDGTPSREVRSMEDLRAAESKGEISLRPTGTVVNAPIMTWLGGRR